jgi:hypothetical protein
MTNSLVTAARDVLQGLVGAWKQMKSAGQKMSGESVRSIRERMSDYSEPIPVGRYAAIAFAVLVVIMLAVIGVTWFSGSNEEAVVQPSVREQAPKIIVSRPLRLASPPPAPYLKLK